MPGLLWGEVREVWGSGSRQLQVGLQATSHTLLLAVPGPAAAMPIPVAPVVGAVLRPALVTP